MAMIKCNECHKEISDQAKSCPYCGCPSEHQKEIDKTQEQNANSARIMWTIIGIIMLIISIWLIYSGYQSLS